MARVPGSIPGKAAVFAIRQQPSVETMPGRSGKPKPSNQWQQVPGTQPRSTPPHSQVGAPRQRERSTSAAGGGASGGSGGPSTTKQGGRASARSMIQRIRSESPSKRQRNASPGSAASSTASVNDPDRPVTEASLNTAMRKMVGIFKQDLSAEFQWLKQELGALHARIDDLENHVAARDVEIENLESDIRNRDDRIMDLENELDRVSSEARRQDLILSGSAIPAAPREHWTEDVSETAIKLIRDSKANVPVSREDIEDAQRVGKGKQIRLRFKSAAKNSVRDRLYQARFQLKPVADNGAGETPKLFVRENLSPRRHEIFQALLREKAAKNIYTVFTRDGEVFCKLAQHGQKIRVRSVSEIQVLLRR